MQTNTTTGLMRIVGHERCGRCNGTGHVTTTFVGAVTMTRTTRTVTCTGIDGCNGSGMRPIYERATGITISFDDPEVTP